MIDSLLTNTLFIPAKLSRNSLSHVIDAANPALTSRVGLKYFLEMKVPDFEGSSNFVALHRSQLREKPPYVAGASTIYEGASTIYNQRNGKLDNLLKVKKPDFRILEPVVITTQSKEFILREIVTGGTPAVNTDVSKAAQWVVKAGVSEVDYQNYSDGFFSTFQSTNRKFLTNQPISKVIGRNQTEYLSFLMNLNPMPSQVRLRIELDDGTTTTVMTVVSPPFMSVVLFPINFTDLFLDENCTSFKVWLSNENNQRISEVRNYYIDTMERGQERYIIFSNSLGGWDTIRLTGESNEVVKVTQTSLVKEQIASDATALSILQVVSTNGDREFTISTGYFERLIKENLSYLEEILLSEDIYLETEKGHRQLKRTTSQLLVKEDDLNNVARILQFQYVESVQNYSNLPVAIAPKRPTGWGAFGNQSHVLDSFGKRTGYKRSESLVKIYTDNNETFKPLTVKANVVSTEGYVEKYFDAGVTIGSTPYPNTLYSRQTTFKKNNCASGYDGLTALISIAAGTYGGEKTGDANTLAIAAANALDTQVYANTYGACTPIGPVYDWTIPANHWHYRVKEPAKMSILFTEEIGTWGAYPGGNDASLQNLSGSYIFGVGTNDLDFPVSGPPNYLGWDIKITGYAAYANKTLKAYLNGVLLFSNPILFNAAGVWQGDAFVDTVRVPAYGQPPANQQKYFWEVV